MQELVHKLGLWIINAIMFKEQSPEGVSVAPLALIALMGYTQNSSFQKTYGFKPPAFINS